MTDHRALSIDPIAQTVTRLTERGYGAVDAGLVAAAWQQALFPLLEDSVGSRLSSRMTQAELADFEARVDAEGAQGATAWLEEHAPHFREVVCEESARLVEEAAEWFERRLVTSTEGID